MSVLKKLMLTPSKNKHKDVPKLQDLPEISDSSRNPYTEVLILSSHKNIVRNVIKVDNNRFLSMSDDGTAVLWNIQTGCKIRTITGEDSRPFSCGIVVYQNQTANYLFISGSLDKSIQIWNLATGECIRMMLEPTSSVRCLLSVRQGEIICSAGNNVCVWGMDGSLLALLHAKHSEDIGGMIGITCGRLVARADNCLYVYSPKVLTTKMEKPAKKLLPHRETISVLENISDGFFASGSVDGTIILWRAYDLLPVRYFNSVKHYKGYDHDYPFSIQHILSLDERYVCAAIGLGFSVFDSLNGKTVIEMNNCHRSKVTYLSMVWDNLLLASCSEDGSVRLWGRGSAFECPAHKQSSGALYTLLGMGENDIPVWQKHKQMATLELLGECIGHSGTIQMLCDCGESGIVTCGVDSLVIMWKNYEIESMKRTETLRSILHDQT